MKELEDILGGKGRASRIVWTSSSNASRDAFNIDDITHGLGSVRHFYSTFHSSVPLNSFVPIPFNRLSIFEIK